MDLDIVSYAQMCNQEVLMKKSGGSKKRHFSISIQILVFTFLLAFLPVAAMMMLKTYEKQLLAAQESALVQQGRLVAASLENNFSKESAKNLLQNMNKQFDARIRVLDDKGVLLVDSSAGDESGASERTVETKSQDNKTPAEETFLYKAFSFPVRIYRKFFVPPTAPRYESADFYSKKNVFDGEEIKAALQGSYGAATRISSGGQVSVTLYSAIPVKNKTDIVGVVLVSRSTYKILRNLYDLRVDLARIFFWSLLAAFVVTVFLSIRISLPLKKLSKEAKSCTDRRGHFVKESLTGSKRHDEIGDLSRSYSELLKKLADRIQFIESFSADVSHEFKNPLAAIRSSVELAQSADSSEKERQEYLSSVIEEVAHLQLLLSGVRKLSRIDGDNDDAEPEHVPVSMFLTNMIVRIQKRYPNVHFSLQTSCPGISLFIDPDRLDRMTENLLDNAASFAKNVLVYDQLIPAKKKNERLGTYILCIEDDGPGVPKEMREKIFERFYSTRKNEDEAVVDSHTGLGLALVKAVVDAAGGSVSVHEGTTLCGACFKIELPL